MEEEWWGAVLTRRAKVAVGFFSSVDTSRESGGEEVESRSNTSGEVGSRFPFTPFSSVRGESKYSLVAGGQRDNRVELQQLVLLFLSTISRSWWCDARDDSDANWVEGVGRVRTSLIRLLQRFP